MFGMSAECGNGTPMVGGLMYRQPPRAISDATVSALGTHSPRTQLMITGSGDCDA
jgi:hypothetical protein